MTSDNCAQSSCQCRLYAQSDSLSNSSAPLVPLLLAKLFSPGARASISIGTMAKVRCAVSTVRSDVLVVELTYSCESRACCVVVLLLLPLFSGFTIHVPGACWLLAGVFVFGDRKIEMDRSSAVCAGAAQTATCSVDTGSWLSCDSLNIRMTCGRRIGRRRCPTLSLTRGEANGCGGVVTNRMPEPVSWHNVQGECTGPGWCGVG